MKELNWDDPAAVQEALDILRENGVVMIQSSYAFALLTVPTQAACDKMAAVKCRPTLGTNFGFAVGDLEAFHGIIDKGSLPASMRDDTAKLATIAKGSHVNVILTQEDSFNSAIVRNGTINGAIAADGSPPREFFKMIEEGLAGYTDPDLLGGKNYSAPLVTSCNEHLKGTIVELEMARKFGLEKGIPLLIHLLDKKDTIADQKGSWPVMELRSDCFRVIRRGVTQHTIMDREEVKEIRVRFSQHIVEKAGLLGDDVSITGLFEVFKSFGKGGNTAYLDQTELHQALVMLTEESGKAPSEEDSNVLFAAIDFNGDGKISLAEFIDFVDSHQMKLLKRKFVSAFKHLVEKEANSAYLKLDVGVFVDAFGSIDLNKDGRVSKEELRRFIAADKKEESLSKVELDLLFELLDLDNSGFLDLSEVYEYLENCVGDNRKFLRPAYLRRSTKNMLVSSEK